MYLIRQYNRKRNAEIRLRNERRKMLEKARMKGKKAGPVQEGEFEDDGMCCTCGQQVGQQHDHVNPPQKGSVDGGGGGGGGPGQETVKGK